MSKKNRMKLKRSYNLQQGHESVGFYTLDSLIAIILLGLALSGVRIFIFSLRQSLEKQRIAMLENLEYISERENASWSYIQEKEKE